MGEIEEKREELYDRNGEVEARSREIGCICGLMNEVSHLLERFLINSIFELG